MSFNDLILFIVIFGSTFTAVVFPEFGIWFQPLIVYFMMFVLFLSFIKIDFNVLLDSSPKALLALGRLVLIKLVVLPAVLYWVALWVIPDYAIPILLLSGISTGVVAPFMASILNAEVAQVARMTVVSSILVPISLPAMVKILAGADVTIPLILMVRILALVIFVPIIAVLFMRKFFPGVLAVLDVHRFPVSLVAFGIINLGVFSQYSSFFYQNYHQVLAAIALAYLLSVIYYVTGFMVSSKHSDTLSAGICLAVMNNVLVIVFSSHFFGPLSPTLAAMYMFPFFTMIVPIKLIQNYTQYLSTSNTKPK